MYKHWPSRKDRVSSVADLVHRITRLRYIREFFLCYITVFCPFCRLLCLSFILSFFFLLWYCICTCSICAYSDWLDDGSSTTVMDILRQKHPSPSSASTSLLKCDPLPQLEDVEITGSHILCSARKIQGGAGPGGCDSCHWHDVLLRYGAHSARLQDADAALTRRLANTVLPWNDIRALVSNRLIALDKCPGVRPIGVGETLRRIIGKAICSATRGDIEMLCGADQLCGGVRSGIEGAIHAMNKMYSQHCTSDDWGVLLVDASNAFNSLNRAALLWNARILWPWCSRFLFNTYSGWAALVVHGSEEFLYSREGVTQGDPLSMFYMLLVPCL